MIFFNRSRVKAQFMGEAAASAPRLFPLSITIIAWFLIIGAVNVWLTFLLPFPMVLFGFVFRGWAGRLIAALFAGISLFAGIGMLKKRVVANSVAIGYFVLGLLNTFSFWVVPGSFAHEPGSSSTVEKKPRSQRRLAIVWPRHDPIQCDASPSGWPRSKSS